MTDSCTCCCGSKKADEKKPADPKVEKAKELKKDEVEAVEYCRRRITLRLQTQILNRVKEKKTAHERKFMCGFLLPFGNHQGEKEKSIS